MSLYARAAQFSPFAALTGHQAAIKETVRQTDAKQVLSEEVIAELNKKLYLITETIGTQQMVEITYFVPDAKKDGGAYITCSGCVKKIDKYKHTVVMTDQTIIPIEQISNIEGVEEELTKRGEQIDFEVASNPEFLKEGAAIKDFMSPDRVVVGIESDRAKKVMERLYRPFQMNNYRLYFMDIPSAEMTKYAANAMLATRISFMNDIANLCDLVGANVDMVRKGIGADTRIGSKFLYPGCGYGGSCFPKDVKALARTAREYGYTMGVIEAVEAVNERQKEIVVKKLQDKLGTLRGKTIALWGLAFKPETDDMREAPALVVIEKLLEAGASVKVYDPVAMDECRRRIGDRVVYCKDMYDVVIDADALAVLTEWKEFRIPSWSVIKRVMKQSVLVDGRNIYSKDEVIAEGFEYAAIGK